MQDVLIAVVAALIGAAGGALGWKVWGPQPGAREVEEGASKLAEAEATLASARKEAEEVLKKAELEAANNSLEREKKHERELSKRKVELERTEQRVRKREEQLERTEEKLQRKLETATEREEAAQRRHAELESEHGKVAEARQQLIKRAEAVSGMTVEEARQSLLEGLEQELMADQAAVIRRVEEETKELSEKKARQILTLAVQRLASDHVSETTVSVVTLPNEEMKGRIIGREGRNIRALEQATGVNFIVDDTPEAVVLSCFDPMRREVARLVLEQLIADGRIHPARIEELVEKTERRVLDAAREAAESACIELGLHDLHPELVKLMGRLKYRTSYGQNVLRHSVECAHIAEMIGSELGLDTRLAKRATFLHDLGKAVSHEVEGPHAAIGANLAKKFGERREVIHAIEAHHFEVEPKTLTAMIVITADSISAARPGARRESLESYIKRLENLEGIAKSFPGVEKSYAIQAGREVRIIVEPDRLNDDQCAVLARDVTKRIESEMQYPGQIKVTVLREVRKTEFAR